MLISWCGPRSSVSSRILYLCANSYSAHVRVHELCSAADKNFAFPAVAAFSTPDCVHLTMITTSANNSVHVVPAFTLCMTYTSLLPADNSLQIMSSRSASRSTRKRMRQATLTAAPVEGDAKVRKLTTIEPVSRGVWNEQHITEGLLLFEPNSWRADPDNALLRRTEPIKVAAFDLDSTLITTKTKAKFPKTALDWRFLLPRVPAALATLASDGYVLVIFTNQAGVSNGRINESFVKTRLDSMMAAVKADIGVFAATMKNNYRKPATGMWEVFVDMLGGIDRIDVSKSFYVGDAAGRPVRPSAAADFSDSDLRFSINIGLRFYTPEEYFGGKEEEAVSRDKIVGFDPRVFLHENSDAIFVNDSTDMNDILRRIVNPAEVVNDLDMGSCVDGSLPQVQTMVIMHGFPASGKTSFVKCHLLPRGYIWINQDTMQTFSRCHRATRDNLAQGRSIVIDNTNPNRAARAKYIDVAKEHNPNIRIIALTMATSKELAQHLNMVRERESNGGIHHVPLVAYHTFLKRVEKPDSGERIDRIAEIRFLPCFGSERERYIFTRLT